MSDRQAFQAAQSLYPALENESSNFETGAFKEVPGNGTSQAVSVPYVTPGDEVTLNALKQALGSSANTNFGKTIESVNVELLNSSQQPIQNEVPTYALVKIDLSDETAPVKFQAKFKTKNKQLVATNVSEVNASKQMSLSLACTDLTCSEIVMVLAKNSDTKAGIIYRVSAPTVAFKKDVNINAYATDSVLEKLYSQSGKFLVKHVSVTVYPGISYSDIELQNSNKQDELSIGADNLDTAEVSSSVIVKTNLAPGLTGETYGYNPDNGSAIYVIKDPKTNNKLFVHVHEKKPDDAINAVSAVFPNIHFRNPQPAVPVQPPTVETPPSSPSTNNGHSSSPVTSGTSDGLFEFPNPQKNKRGYEMTLGFARYQNNSYIRNVINSWRGLEPMPQRCQPVPNLLGRLKRFLTYAPNVAPYIDTVADDVQVSPDIGYLLALETNYATEPSFRSLQTTSNTTAVGPWQIEVGAAKAASKEAALELNDPSFSFKFLTEKFDPHDRFGKKPNPADDRTYLINSTAMAGYYLIHLMKKHHFNDPALAIMAYRWGSTKVTKAQTAVQGYGDPDISINEILNYRIRSERNCRDLTYTLEFLALRTIGQHPDVYGLHITPAQSNAFETRLKNPYSQLPPNVQLNEL